MTTFNPEVEQKYHEKNYQLDSEHEDNSFCPDDAPVGCRIGAAKTNYGLRAG